MDNQSRTVLAIAVNVAFTATAVAAEDDKVTELGKISVDADAGAYKADVPSSPKYTELLRDTAQTITVIPADLIQQQGGLLLRDVLRQNVPGITFGAGEGGSYGDSINIRGFVAPESVTVGDQLEIVNKTNPKQVGPHTFSLVTKSSIPKTKKQIGTCFTPKKICFAVAQWHGFNPKTEKITKNPAKAGPAGWSTMGTATGKKGDSWFSGETKGGHISQEVTAEAGTTLYFMCAIHPFMHGQIKVVAPVVPTA